MSEHSDNYLFLPADDISVEPEDYIAYLQAVHDSDEDCELVQKLAHRRGMPLAGAQTIVENLSILAGDAHPACCSLDMLQKLGLLDDDLADAIHDYLDDIFKTGPAADALDRLVAAYFDGDPAIGLDRIDLYDIGSLMIVCDIPALDAFSFKTRHFQGNDLTPDQFNYLSELAEAFDFDFIESDCAITQIPTRNQTQLRKPDQSLESFRIAATAFARNGCGKDRTALYLKAQAKAAIAEIFDLAVEHVDSPDASYELVPFEYDAAQRILQASCIAPDDIKRALRPCMAARDDLPKFRYRH